MDKALILGAGFSGRAIGQSLVADGWHVSGTTRSRDKLAGLDAVNITGVEFDGVTLNDPIRSALGVATHVVVSIAPPRTREESMDRSQTDPFLAALGEEVLSDLAPHLKWIGYLSTVGVYGNHDGAWVDEQTQVAPVSVRSKQRVAAENEWRNISEQSGIPLAIFRLSGIYGPGRNALVTASKGASRRLVKPGQVFNRIHVDDIAEAVRLAARSRCGGLFNITDNLPAPPQDVVTFAHELIGTQPPEELDFETADLTPMARSFYGENKRVSNQRSKDVLKLDYQWPDYRQSLRQMWENDLWQG